MRPRDGSPPSKGRPLKHQKILFVHPQHEVSYWGFQHSLPLYGKKAMHPPLGLITVAALLPRCWDLRLVDTNIEELDDEDILWADMVFTGGMTSQADSLLELLDRCKRLDRPTVVGGPFGSGHPQRLENKPDYMVLDEAEITLPLFLEDLERGEPKAIYRSTDKPDVSQSPIPRFDLLDLAAYGVMDIQFSRGCPFNCEFCDIITLYGRVPRTKTPEQTLAEFQALHELGYRGPLFLVDDNFIGNKKAVRKLMELLIPWMEERNRPFTLITEASVNLAEDDRLLEDMYRAGFKRVFLGIETPSLESLKETQKLQNMRRSMVESVHHIIDHGIQVMAGFIVGFDNDEEDIFDRQIEFIQQAEIPWAMVGVLAAIPNTQLWTRLEKEGRLLGYHTGDQFGRTNFRTNLDSDVLMRGYLRILETIYQPDAYFERVMSVVARIHASGRDVLPLKDVGYLKVALITVVSAVIQGVLSSYKGRYWKFLWTLVTRYPSQYMVGILNSVVGHHFIRYTEEVLEKERTATARPLDLKPIHRPEPADAS